MNTSSTQASMALQEKPACAPLEISSLPQVGEQEQKKGPPASDNTHSEPDPLPYSNFTRNQKRLIVSLVTFAATFSPLSSFIFFPAIDASSVSLHVSVEKINTTVTSYLIVAGVAPAVIGDMADMTGRRVVYLLTMGIYCVANVGLAVRDSWTALFILRMLQSAGSTGMDSSITD